MAEFFLSVPGALVVAGLGILLLSRRGARRSARAYVSEPDVRLTMQIVVSVVILAAGLWVLLSGHYAEDATRWAAGAIGTVVGYWLKP